MPQARSTSVDSESTTQAARFTVALPKDVGKQIDKLAAKMSEQMRKQYGIGVELSRGQVVTAVVQSALQTFADTEAAQTVDAAAATEPQE